MPSMADITVKKADGTTDVIYVAMAPSSGDKTPAIWMQNAFSAYQGHRPWLEVRAASNSTGTYRHINGKFSYPTLWTDASGMEQILGPISGDFHLALPVAMPTTGWIEAGAQFGNLIDASLIQAIIAAGYSPT
jgi:hypothetical protein